MQLNLTPLWQDRGKMEALLINFAVFLAVLVVLTAIGYYAWRRTSGRGFQFEKLSGRQLGIVGLISVAIPILAACLQTAWVVNSSTRLYTALLSNLSDPGLWLFVMFEASLTFILLAAFMKVALWFRWPVLLLCCAFWIYIGMNIIGVHKGYA